MSQQLLAEWSNELAGLADVVGQSLVQVSNRRNRGNGAGVIWTADGLIITNAHVVRSRHPQVKLADGRTFDAEIVAHDSQRDLAALRIDAAGLTAVTRGDSRSLRPGDWVLATGHPWGVVGAATAGAIIDIGRPNEMPASYGGELLQVGLQLRPGHSGGPMVDKRGHLVGINTMISGPAVGLAVPVHVVDEFLEDNRLLQANNEFI